MTEAEIAKRKLAMEAMTLPLLGGYLGRPIDYIDPTPAPFIVQIPLVEYFERIKRHKADTWQIDFCNRLQEACVNRHEKTTRASVHAEAQLGKSSILAQCFPAWILGHDPLHRIALSTYNVSRSQAHSKAVIGIINLPTHQEIFPKLEGRVPPGASKEKWQTNARTTSSTDAQDSFNPVGLQSGLTGSGFDTLIIDDPYADQKEAFSETTRKNLQEFWDFTVMSRIGTYSNVFGMFHRYHVEDLAGYLLNTGKFDYWRYATVADGPYIHDDTGQKFEDPLGRSEGEYISPTRRGPSYYADNRKNKRVWMSMFQGRPSAEEGEFFNIGKLTELTAEETARMRAECSVLIRAWDSAATEDGGDYSTGFLFGMKTDGSGVILDVKRKQVESSGRRRLQQATAAEDGPDVVVSIPEDPGAAGKDSVEYVKEKLQGYTVVARRYSTSKENRARNMADAVNSGDIALGYEGNLPDDDKWHKALKTEFRNFPLSEHDDIVDAGSDAYNESFGRVSKGLVVKNYHPQNSLVTWSSFDSRFRVNGKPLERIPRNWTVYAAVKVTPDAVTPNSAVIVAKAPRNTGLEDTLFVLAEYKEYTADVIALFDWIDAALDCYCENGKEDVLIWLHPDSAGYKQTIWQKISRRVAVFKGDETAGISELDWYLLKRDYASPFNENIKATGLYGVVADAAQLAVPTDEYGLRAMRQELATWSFNDKGDPSAVGAVLDCLRMITYSFRTVATDFTRDEMIENALAPHIQTEAILNETDPQLQDQLLERRRLEVAKVVNDLDKPVRGAHSARFARR